MITPRARMEHHESPRERRSRDQLVRVELVSRYERVRAGTGNLSRRAFWISAVGQLVWYGAKGLVTFSGERLARRPGTPRPAWPRIERGRVRLSRGGWRGG